MNVKLVTELTAFYCINGEKNRTNRTGNGGIDQTRKEEKVISWEIQRLTKQYVTIGPVPNPDYI